MTGSRAPSRPETPPSLGKVLLVEDDILLLRAAARQLTRAGYEVAPFSQAAVALQAIERGGFEVVVSDIGMPEMDGISLLCAIRELDLDLPVILVTGTPTLDTAVTALEHGALKYLTKPVAVNVLVDTVAQAVAFSRLTRMKRNVLTARDHQSNGASERAQLDIAFCRALDSLWIAFQPIVRASDGSLYGYEALLRSEELSLPNPGAVLDAAERLGQVRHLGRAIREKSVKPLLGTRHDCALFLDLHLDDLLDPELLDASSAMGRLGTRVVLQIRERAALERLPDASGRIARARALGYRIAVDQGAGYAGLSSLSLLEPEIVKLDMSLVRDVHRSATKQKLIGSMAALCNETGALTVAEGVETVEERDTVVSLGCDLLQGVRFGKPTAALLHPTW